MLALFALTLQLVLSFAHVHADELTGAPHGVASVAQAAGAPDHNSEPDGDHHDDFCDICVTLHFLATAQISAPPLLVLPVAYARVTLSLTEQRVIAAAHRAQFRSRAPPIA